MTGAPSLAVFGSAPLFSEPVRCGQRFFPDRAQYEAMFRDIFERQYYTNHGPLTQELERRLAERLQVRHAICVTNEFLGLVSAGHALGVHGRVVVPGHCAAATPQSLSWTAADPLFCDVDPRTGMMTAELVAQLLRQAEVSAILAVNPWGDACDLRGLQALADESGIPMYVDSTHGFGSEVNGRPLGSFGAAEILSFQSDNVLGACEGGVVCTQDDDLAAHVRNTRSSYGMGRPVPVPKTCNGRMSEAQAAVALYNLDRYAEHRQRNKDLFDVFISGCSAIPGFEIRVAAGVDESNFQNLICLVDEASYGLSRDGLWRILRAENVLAGKGFPALRDQQCRRAGLALGNPTPHAEHYGSKTLELPLNSRMTRSDAERLVDLIYSIQRASDDIRTRLAGAA